jgi:hypothetical protein
MVSGPILGGAALAGRRVAVATLLGEDLHMENEGRWTELSREITVLLRRVEQRGLNPSLLAAVAAALPRWQDEAQCASRPHVDDPEELQRAIAGIASAIAQNERSAVEEELRCAADHARTPAVDWVGPLFDRFTRERDSL